MDVVVVGAGALGSLLGGLLARGGQRVWLYNRSRLEHVEAIRARGLTLLTAGEEQRVGVEAAVRIDEIPSPVDLVLVTVKAHDTERAAADARLLLGEGTAVLSLQNGVGVEELLAGHISKARIMRGVTAQGATLVKPGVVRWAGRGPTWIGSPFGDDGPPRGRIGEIVRAFGAAGLEAHHEPELARRVWMKLLVNAAINPLTALFDVPNGRLVEDSLLRGIVGDLVREALPVVREHGVALLPEEAVAEVEGVCRATAENLSSMLQDVRRGRRTEIAFINGAVVREGERLGFPVPLHRLLTALVEWGALASL